MQRADGAAGAEERQATAITTAHLGAAASKLVSASVGDIAVVFSRAESHKHFTLADIQTVIVPPVLLGQFYVAELAHKEQGVRAPVAAVTWAYVSVEVDRRLRAQASERVKLAPSEWKSGEITWPIDMVGEPLTLDATLRKIRADVFAEKTVNVWTISRQEEADIMTLQRALETQNFEPVQ